MAIDTKEERFAIMNFGSSLILILPPPSEAMTTGARFHFLGLFYGRVVGIKLEDVTISLPRLASVEVKQP